MTHRPFAAFATALLLAAVAAPALAASHNRDTFIKEQDLNGDGRVSKDEMAAGRDKEFAGVDADKDGGLSQAEYVGEFKTRLEGQMLPKLPANRRDEERMRQMRQADVRFGVLDTDKNGRITGPEFAYSGWAMFMTHDTNKDGFVDATDTPAKDDDAA